MISEQQQFLVKLKDPDEYDIIIDGIKRTLNYYKDIVDAKYVELPNRDNYRTWRIMFKAKFGNTLPSLHIPGDIHHNFKQGNERVTTTITSFDVYADKIPVYVSLKDTKPLVTTAPPPPPIKSKLKPTTLNTARARKNA